MSESGAIELLSERRLMDPVLAGRPGVRAPQRMK